ncbi:uncharacterized protein WM294_014209 [Sarcoramphus papa]
MNLNSLDLSGQDDGARPGFWQGMAHLHKGRLRQAANAAAELSFSGPPSKVSVWPSLTEVDTHFPKETTSSSNGHGLSHKPSSWGDVMEDIAMSSHAATRFC